MWLLDDSTVWIVALIVAKKLSRSSSSAANVAVQITVEVEMSSSVGSLQSTLAPNGADSLALTLNPCAQRFAQVSHLHVPHHDVPVQHMK